MSRARQLIRSPLAWGVLTFVMMFVVASAIANTFWKNGRRDSLGRILELEIQGILADAQMRRLPPLSPLRKGVGSPQYRLVQQFLDGASVQQMEKELQRFMERHPNAPVWQREVWQEWGRTLDEIHLEIPGARPEETTLGRKLHQARWHIARAQGWLIIGDGDRGLVHFLRAIKLCREVQEQAGSDEHQVEASYIAGKALFLLFGRSALLREVRSLGSSAIWSVRAERMLLKDRRS
jgi:hypothetical protein